MSALLVNELSADERNRAWQAFINSPGVKQVLCDWFFQDTSAISIGMKLSDARDKVVVDAVRASYQKGEYNGTV